MRHRLNCCQLKEGTGLTGTVDGEKKPKQSLSLLLIAKRAQKLTDRRENSLKQIGTGSPLMGSFSLLQDGFGWERGLEKGSSLGHSKAVNTGNIYN